MQHRRKNVERERWSGGKKRQQEETSFPILIFPLFLLLFSFSPGPCNHLGPTDIMPPPPQRMYPQTTNGKAIPGWKWKNDRSGESHSPKVESRRPLLLPASSSPSLVVLLGCVQSDQELLSSSSSSQPNAPPDQIIASIFSPSTLSSFVNRSRNRLNLFNNFHNQLPVPPPFSD